MTKMFRDYPDVVNIKQLMEMLHIGRSSAYKLILEGIIKSFKLGRNYKIPKTSVIDYVEGKYEIDIQN